MTTLKEAAKSYKGKKELTDLEKIPVDISFQEGTFTNDQNKEIKFNFIEIDGYKYTIRSALMSQIKRLLDARPMTKNIKIQEEKGETFVIPLD